MIITKLSLPRRELLRGAGATLALPLLDAMIAPMTALAATPADPARLRRLGFVFMPMGSDITRWTPPDATRLDRLSPTLSPLEKHKNDICVISNLELVNAYPGTHSSSNSAFLSAAKAKHTESTDYYLGTTVDQIAAKQLGKETQLRAGAGLQGRSWDCRHYRRSRPRDRNRRGRRCCCLPSRVPLQAYDIG